MKSVSITLTICLHYKKDWPLAASFMPDSSWSNTADGYEVGSGSSQESSLRCHGWLRRLECFLKKLDQSLTVCPATSL